MVTHTLALASIWFAAGTVYLAILTYHDFKHKTVIDERFNYLAVGATLFMAAQIGNHWWYALGAGLASVVLGMLTVKRLWADGDAQSVTWMALGTALLNPLLFAMFLVALLSTWLIFNLLRYILRVPKEARLPYFSVLLMVHIIIWVAATLLLK